MEIKTLVYGLYPRSERLRTGLSKWERGIIKDNEIEQLISDESKLFHDSCMAAGIELCGDPLFNWFDILRPLALSIEGVRLGALTRYKETNTFYRKPVIDRLGELRDIRLSVPLEDNPPLPMFHEQDHNYLYFLPGIHSFLEMSEINGNREGMADRMLEIYSEIIKMLSIKSLVIYEAQPHANLAIYEKLATNVYLVTTGKIDEWMFDNGGDNIHSIIADDPYEVERHCKIPGLKLVDSFNTKIEEDGLEKLKRYKDDFGELIVTSNDSLDFLPRAVADRKIAIMGSWGK